MSGVSTPRGRRGDAGKGDPAPQGNPDTPGADRWREGNPKTVSEQHRPRGAETVTRFGKSPYQWVDEQSMETEGGKHVIKSRTDSSRSSEGLLNEAFVGSMEWGIARMSQRRVSGRKGSISSCKVTRLSSHPACRPRAIGFLEVSQLGGMVL